MRIVARTDLIISLTSRCLWSVSIAQPQTHLAAVTLRHGIPNDALRVVIRSRSHERALLAVWRQC